MVFRHFTVTRFPLSLAECHARDVCPPGPDGYRVRLGRFTDAASIRDLWHTVLSKTIAMGFGCTGADVDLPLAQILAHALEHLTVLDLSVREVSHHHLYPPSSTLAVSGLIAEGSPHALFYVRSGCAATVREERKSVKRAIQEACSILYPRTWFLR
jgi:hypothetical protein